MDFTIVTACTADYLAKLKLTLPTWTKKPQFKDKPILVFYNGIKESELDFIKVHFKDITLIKWEMPNVSSQRELVLSCFVFAAEYVKTEHYIKIDSETFFTNSLDVFDLSDFDYDLVAHRWGYTKPGYFLDVLDNFFFQANIPIVEVINVRAQPRIASFICLHKVDFVKEVISKIGRRLPIPSHDTLLWYCADKFKGRRWKAKNVKKLGVNQTSRYRILRKELEVKPEIKTVPSNFPTNVQLEITTRCNLGCINCDRNCGIAPSSDEMTVSQVAGFIKESLELNYKWDRIDIIGGEPTLHKDLLYIIDVIKPYHLKYPKCVIRLSTNGLDKANEVLKTLPSFVKIRNSNKKGKINKFVACNDAPIDHGIAECKPCNVPFRCGLGLSKYGYFPCGVGAALCRVFGFDIGFKSLKDYNDKVFKDQLSKICKYCGASMTSNRHFTEKEEISKSWKDALEVYKTKKLTEI